MWSDICAIQVAQQGVIKRIQMENGIDPNKKQFINESGTPGGKARMLTPDAFDVSFGNKKSKITISPRKTR